ncbi:MAG: hypothetical protein ACT4P5_23010 [Armatimonadota bacterium]
MISRASRIVLGLGLSLSRVEAAGPTVSASLDTTAAFLGVFVHGPLVPGGGPDNHLDVFGGANWTNDVDFNAAILVAPNEVAFIEPKITHTVAPHGEAPGARFANLINVSVNAVPGAFQVLARSRVQAQAHVNHTDMAGSALVLGSAASKVTAYIGLAIAVHKVPAKPGAFLVGWLKSEDKRLDRVFGGAALVVEDDTKTAFLGTGVCRLSRGEIRSVRLYSTAQPEQVAAEVEPGAFEEREGAGVAAAVPITIADLSGFVSSAVVVIETARGTLRGELASPEMVDDDKNDVWLIAFITAVIALLVVAFVYRRLKRTRSVPNR